MENNFKHEFLALYKYLFFRYFCRVFYRSMHCLCGHVLLAITDFRSDYLYYCLVLMPIVTSILICPLKFFTIKCFR